ncbi:toll-like receptor 4 [Mytilus californianus]|uniref:toll-like receptor 4 n=1 Tax=Mytilus californianus TaxID=6549 RepID=UPI002245B55A|nr:toll-like receptor 4 [Mytilus californianus]
MNIIKIILLWSLTALQEAKAYSNETKCNVQNTIVDCCNLVLTTIPRHLPVNATRLDLSRNSIKIVRSFAFQSLRYITDLYLERNLIQLIEKNAFHGLHRLRSLNLNDNSIKLFPNGMFDRLNGLQDLSIVDNKLQYFQDNKITEILNMIKNLSLRKLSFDIYPDFKFPSEWCTLSKMVNLGIFARSAKVQFNKEMFVHVNVLQIMSLYIDVVPFISEDFFEHFPKLDSITLSIGSDLPNNPIDQVFKSFGVFRGRNLTNIEIKSGRFDNGFTLNHKRMKYLWSICLKRLTLNNLYIKDILIYASQVFSIQSTCLEYLEISENIIMDRGGSIFTVFQNFKSLKVLKIKSNWRRSRSKRSQPSRLYTFKLVLPKTLKELYIEDDMACDMVNVKVINGLNLRVVSLKDNDIWSCEGSFAGVINVEYFDMSGWTCEKLSINLLYGFPNLKTLKASRSLLGHGFVNTAGAGSFLRKNLRLQDINLSSNKIHSIPNGLFLKPFEQLSSVNMSHNYLTIFPKFHARIKAMKIIDLTFNRITHFKDDDIDQIEKLEEVDIFLRGNPFQCSCETLQFLKWLGQTNRVPDILDLTCVTEKASRRFMSEVISNLQTFEISCKTKFWLAFAVSITSIVVIAIIITVIFFRYKYAVEYVLLRLKMKMKNYKELRQEYTYDAFISYSHTDSGWVKKFHDVVKSMGFELCLDAKDFIAGYGIAENVINAIDSSRKVIFIITHDFLKSTWGSYEMEMTRMHAFQKGREDMVIIVVRDKIKVNDMPEILKSMWFKITCIQWPNDDNLPYNTKEIFYEKMKMSLKMKEETTLLYSRNSAV